ncbi:tripartite-type tricarboxylate transporter receptor subunit TctC [Massilia aurea]|jgi:tripartite-type tricarboxylate transporter receptor subunit TctC|uniref:Tripartite-type tricarboxylate transporter receptor subunit TctC n=1 Tax=Massilia aurea TaxID=373040 RepID=A0A7W9U663_9BURK|nr:tripartite tricarboxylate transporter substrate binding protein [Massilia aurea]MBB6132351.1 tripartite-type tricarboxylate transporter receptor subunit TctC [Massilia aurea]
MIPQKKQWLAIGLAALGVCTSATAAAADAAGYPKKAITIVVPFGPGGVADLTVRMVAQKMAVSMKQPIIVENRPGAGGVVAANTVAKASPDGYTLLLMSNGTAVSANLFKKLPYDTQKDFTPISTLGYFDLALLVNPKLPVKSVGELIAYAKANPGKLNIGTINRGSTQNLAAELFVSMAGMDALVVPYKGSPEVLTATTTGELDAAFEILSPALPQIKAGTVKAIAVTSAKRFSGLPNVPTVAESGLPNYQATSWNALAAPAKTPQPIVDRLHREINAAVAMPDVKARLLGLGIVAQGATPVATATLLKTDIAKWGAVITKAGIEKQ